MDKLQLYFFSQHIKEASNPEDSGMSDRNKAILAALGVGALGTGAVVGPGFVRGLKKGFKGVADEAPEAISEAASNSASKLKKRPKVKPKVDYEEEVEEVISAPKPKKKPKKQPKKQSTPAPKKDPKDEIVFRRAPDSVDVRDEKREYRLGDWEAQNTAFMNEQVTWRDSLGNRRTGRRWDHPQFRMTYF